LRLPKESKSFSVPTDENLVLLGAGAHYTEKPLFRHSEPTGLSVRETTAIQACTACLLAAVWQLCYTVRHLNEVVVRPARDAGTSVAFALLLYSIFGTSNIVHATSFFYTLQHYPGGATSAGLFKGLQAVLVFLATHFLYCGRIGGAEMCFTLKKLTALVAVVGGVVLFSINPRCHS
jgi:hypothetical protein